MEGNFFRETRCPLSKHQSESLIHLIEIIYCVILTTHARQLGRETISLMKNSQSNGNIILSECKRVYISVYMWLLINY